jgi:hypothetical protein
LQIATVHMCRPRNRLDGRIRSRQRHTAEFTNSPSPRDNGARRLPARASDSGSSPTTLLSRISSSLESGARPSDLRSTSECAIRKRIGWTRPDGRGGRSCQMGPLRDVGDGMNRYIALNTRGELWCEIMELRPDARAHRGDTSLRKSQLSSLRSVVMISRGSVVMISRGNLVMISRGSVFMISRGCVVMISRGGVVMF